MSDDLLGRYTRRDALREDFGAAEGDTGHSSGCFGFLRGIRDRAFMLELRKTDGRTLGIGYAWLESVEYDPDIGITLHFGRLTVAIRGVGLNAGASSSVRLFEGILRHRVPWIQEAAPNATLDESNKATIVQTITWD